MGKNSDNKWINSVRSFDYKLANTALYICVFLLIAVMTVMFIAVLGRFIFKFSTPWSEEFTRFTFIAMSFLGMGASLTTNEHIEIDVFATFVNGIQNSNNKWLAYKFDDLFRFVFIGCLSLFLGYMYFNYTLKQYTINQISAGLHLPMWMLYAILTVAFVILLIHCILNVIIIIFNYEVIRSKGITKGGLKS